MKNPLTDLDMSAPPLTKKQARVISQEKFTALVEKKKIHNVRDALFALVRAWRHEHDVRLCVWPSASNWHVWVEYGTQHGLSGHAAVEGVRGEGHDVESAIRDCTLKWFVYLHVTDQKRDEAIEDAYSNLARAWS